MELPIVRGDASALLAGTGIRARQVGTILLGAAGTDAVESVDGSRATHVGGPIVESLRAAAEEHGGERAWLTYPTMGIEALRFRAGPGDPWLYRPVGPLHGEFEDRPYGEDEFLLAARAAARRIADARERDPSADF